MYGPYQRAKKVVSNSQRLEDFAIGLVAWVSGLPKGLEGSREEILDGGGGRGRRERKAWHKTIQQIVWHIQNLDVAVIG